MISEIIESILRERSSAEKEFLPCKNNLEQWSELIGTIESYLNNNEWGDLIADNGKNDEWSSIQKAASDLKSELVKLGTPDSNFYKAWYRASRKWLNLGAIGTWRQGKSEFISKLTGLDEWLIPRHDSNDACTGTTVNIINGRLGGDENGKSDFARVYYYDVVGISKILNAYFKKLKLEYSCSAVNKIELRDFVLNNRRSLLGKAVTNTRLFAKLKEYFEHTEYIDLLRESSEGQRFEDIDNITSIESKQNLYKLMCYYDSPTTSDDIRTYKVLAVKSVDIYTSYLLLGEDVGKIQIYDTPGLGEAKLGVDEALIHALRYDLDIAVALRKARVNDPFNEDDAKLNTILKTELNARAAKNEWLYFLLNYYSTTPVDVVRQLKNSISADLEINITVDSERQDDLQSDQKSGKECIEKISLSDDHFGVVDCKNDKLIDISSDTITENNDGVKTFVKTILSKVVGTIATIDNDFYKDARREYKQMSDKYEALVRALSALQLPSVFSSAVIVPNDLLSINQELVQLGNVDITKDISNKLNLFADETTVGTQLLQLILHDDYSSYISKVKEINERVEKAMKSEHSIDLQTRNYKKKILIVKNLIEMCSPAVIIPHLQYNAYREFSVYSDRKAQFAEELKNAISKQIDDKSAKEIIQETKNKIWNVLRKGGRLSFLCPNGTNEEWYQSAVAYFDEKGYYNLKRKMMRMHDFGIDIQGQIETFKNSISKCFHKDDFGTLNFENEENATLSFMYSLYVIEGKTKDYILNSNEVVQGLISVCNESFEQCITDFSQIASMHPTEKDPNNSTINPCWSELNDIFTKNFDTIYASDPRKTMQETISGWNKSVGKHIQ